ncbi:Wd repeat-containing protein [Thalictrum thalictroides]|uniref:Wd repeat-containing protein n=1 Tax=Thalictrum thalictroides TaxID=46969 RepID=A0A7J6WQQ2_THATH|nr:Wd repeat-containing protein [Thalictrum thalictroides]
MKVRSLKLKEAHKNTNGLPSFCSILWDLEAEHLVTSSSSDSSISIHDFINTSISPKIVRNHKDGVTAIALSPNSTCLASGSIDHSVKLYRFPGGEFQTNITRFTLPIRALAFNKSGSMLGAAGDDEGIKLINTIDGSIARVLKGHKGSVISLAFDPIGEYLVSVDSIGTVMFWELGSGKVLHTLKGVAPDTGSDMSALSVLSWSPDGNVLAVPGLKGDIVIYDRDTAEKIYSLKGEHEKAVCFVSWSPNGKYMATSGLDRQVLIWDVDQRQDIDRQKLDHRISCMAWKPNGNALAVIDVMGKYGVWESTVPSSMKSPTDGASLKSKSSGLLLFDDDDDQEPSSLGNMSDADEDSFGESELVSRKRLRKQSDYDNMLDEDSDYQKRHLPKVEPRKKVSRSNKEGLDDANEKIQSAVKSERSKMQEAFQPGCTPVQSGKRRFLCYNMLGSITTIENDGCSHIEVDFHDTGRGPRVPSMTDYFGFTMASLNESGSVFANPCKGEKNKNMSTLMYRPFSSWANNSEWSMRFEAEEVKAVAIGTGWIAAVTSLNILRIFTEGGLQRYILSLDGRVVTAAGFRDELAVVTHASHPLPSNDQMLEFRVFNISNGTQPLRGRLALTPGSFLSWFGFSEDGQLSSYDSEGMLRVFTNQYGGSWIPVFSASKEKKSDESYWMVGLNSSKVFCIECKSPDIYPAVTPKPVLTLLSLSFPLASSDLGADNLENEFLLNNLYLLQAQKKIEELTAAGLDTTAQDDEVFTLEASLDRCILRLINACCIADKLVRATELVRLISMEKSMKGAIKLVTALKHPSLAERFSGILEERMLKEALEAATPSSVSDAALGSGFEAQEQTKLTENKASEPEVASTPSEFSSPQFTRQGKTEEKNKLDVKKIEPNRTRAEGTLKDEGSREQPHRHSNPFLKPLNSQHNLSNKNVNEVDIKEGGSSVSQSHRPANPFVKASSSQKSSLFDSIKKKTDQ